MGSEVRITAGEVPATTELVALYAAVGWLLVTAVLERYAAVRQKVLLTDDEPGQRAFYESLGYVEIRDLTAAPLRAFVRFDG